MMTFDEWFVVVEAFSSGSLADADSGAAGTTFGYIF
jgi:hypothetical protein